MSRKYINTYFLKKFDHLKIEYRKDPKKYILLFLGFILVFFMMIGSSYAYLTYISKTDNSTTIEAGTLAMEFKNESNSITLDGALPQDDDDALINNKEYEFSVTNNGTLQSNYIITLDNTCSLERTYIIDGEEITPDKCVPNDYIKVGIKEENGEYRVLEYDKEKEEYVLETGILKPDENKNYKMKIWLDSTTPNDYNSENVYNIIYSAKLGLDFEQTTNDNYDVSYKIVYDANGGEGEMEDTLFDGAEEKSLAKNNFLREGYTFIGWSKNENSNIATYKDEEVVSKLSDKDNEQLKLYAVWEINDYKIKFIFKTDKEIEQIKNVKYQGNIEFEVLNFDGYNSPEMICTDGVLSDFTNNIIKIENVKQSGECSINYTPNNYTIQYNLDFGEFETEVPDNVIYNANVTISNPIREGYTFSGWTSTTINEKTAYYDDVLWKDGSIKTKSTSFKNLTTDNNGQVILVANWDANTYTIKYDGNGATGGSTSESIHTYDIEKALSPNGFVKEGYQFLEWNTKSDGTGISYGNEELVKNLSTSSDVTLYARWGAKPYTIKYHANGGTGTMIDQRIEYDKPTALYKNTYYLEGYTFGGWALSENGEVKYNDGQIVVNLLEEGTIDLYAVWIQNSYTVTFDYNGGTGSPDSKQVLANEEYGVLPTYPKKTNYIFVGWYTAPSGGKKVLPTTIVDRDEDHTLYAQWAYSPANDVIKDLVIESNADANEDGIVDSMHLYFRCSSSYEKLNIPMENLVVGQKYKLTFVASNNASFGDNEAGYKNAIYGSIITPEGSLSAGSIKEESIADGGLIAQWSDRSKGDEWLNGPWDWSMTFVAEATTMYWTWDFGLIEDGILYDYNFTDIILEPVVPNINFSQKSLKLPTANAAKVLNDVSTSYSTKFDFDGDSGCESLYYPITNLSTGLTYTITLKHSYRGSLIGGAGGSYDYGFGIHATAPTSSPSKMTGYGTFASNTFVLSTVSNGVETVTLTFKATAATMYWVWNMSNVSDSVNAAINVEVINFSAKDSSGNVITYYQASS